MISYWDWSLCCYNVYTFAKWKMFIILREADTEHHDGRDSLSLGGFSTPSSNILVSVVFLFLDQRKNSHCEFFSRSELRSCHILNYSCTYCGFGLFFSLFSFFSFLSLMRNEGGKGDGGGTEPLGLSAPAKRSPPELSFFPRRAVDSSHGPFLDITYFLKKYSIFIWPL